MASEAISFEKCRELCNIILRNEAHMWFIIYFFSVHWLACEAGGFFCLRNKKKITPKETFLKVIKDWNLCGISEVRIASGCLGCVLLAGLNQFSEKCRVNRVYSYTQKTIFEDDIPNSSICLPRKFHTKILP